MPALNPRHASWMIQHTIALESAKRYYKAIIVNYMVDLNQALTDTRIENADRSFQCELCTRVEKGREYMMQGCYRSVRLLVPEAQQGV